MVGAIGSNAFAHHAASRPSDPPPPLACPQPVEPVLYADRLARDNAHRRAPESEYWLSLLAANTQWREAHADRRADALGLADAQSHERRDRLPLGRPLNPSDLAANAHGLVAKTVSLRPAVAAPPLPAAPTPTPVAITSPLTGRVIDLLG